MYEENSFENKLRELRARKHWTQDDAAQHLGVSLHTYSNWETGKRIPSPKRRTQIAELFRLKQEEADALYRAAGQVPPETNNLPVPQNPFFTGREAQLKQLKQLLVQNKSAAITQPVSISGLGGIGKTQLALEYAHKSYRDMYRAVFWVDAAEKSTLEAGYDDLAHMLALPERNEQKLDRRIQAVKRWLEGQTNWLLILDNADNLQLARSFLPVKYNGHILLTTRSQIVGNIAGQIVIEAMEPEAGLLFLLKRAGILQHKADVATLAADVRDAAIELVTLLGGHPLALDQAGAYIEEAGVSVADYLQLYQDMRRFLLHRRGLEESEYGDHPDSVATTIKLSFKKACKQHPMAADILHFCSFLQPDAIPDEVLQQDDGLQIDEDSFNEAVVALRCYSLIKRNVQEKTLSLHRLVQAVLIDSMSPDLRQQWRERVVRALNAAFPKVEFKEWKQCKRLVMHALVCATWTDDELTPTLGVSELLQKAGDYLREQAQHAEAGPLLVRALSIREQCLEAEHSITVISLDGFVTRYLIQGMDEEAEPLYRHALAILEQRLGTEHPSTAIGLIALAARSRLQGMYGQAEALYRRALAIREQQLGPTHRDTQETS